MSGHTSQQTRPLARRFTLLFALLPLLVGAEPGAPRATALVTRMDGVSVRFTCEIAATDEARRRGLMHRASLAARQCMWFDFQEESFASMWMKNTLIPLDMVFVNGAGAIVSVHANAVPGSLQRISPPNLVRSVFEINAGEAARFAIEAGDRVLLIER